MEGHPRRAGRHGPPGHPDTFYQRIIDRTQADTDQEHLRALIWSDAKIPDRTAGILGTPEQAEAVFASICWPTHSCWRGRAVRSWPSPAIRLTTLPTGSRPSCTSPSST